MSKASASGLDPEVRHSPRIDQCGCSFTGHPPVIPPCPAVKTALSVGLLPILGSLYGVDSALVGWVTHLFHSVVFGLLFAAGVSYVSAHRGEPKPFDVVGLGFGWGMVLWLVAAGVVMPIWMTILGLPTRFPNLSLLGFVGHGVWGLTLATVFYAFGTARFDR